MGIIPNNYTNNWKTNNKRLWNERRHKTDNDFTLLAVYRIGTSAPSFGGSQNKIRAGERRYNYFRMFSRVIKSRYRCGSCFRT